MRVCVLPCCGAGAVFCVVCCLVRRDLVAVALKPCCWCVFLLLAVALLLLHLHHQCLHLLPLPLLHHRHGVVVVVVVVVVVLLGVTVNDFASGRGSSVTLQ